MASRGEGTVFINGCGDFIEYNLQPNQLLKVSTSHVVAWENSVAYDIQSIGGIKTALFGGEGIFLARVTGSGQVWLQSLPFSRLASRVFAAAPQRGGSREEGSVLGGVVGGGLLGGILSGDDE